MRPPISFRGLPSRQAALFFGTALLVVLADQLAKYLVRANLALDQSVPPDGIVRITHITNTGTFFGLFPGQAAFFLWFGLATVALILLFYRSPAFQQSVLRLVLGLELGGGIGNLIDRLRWGHVVDFIDLRVWPVFNLADASIIMGLVVLAGYLLLTSRNPTRA